MKVINEEAIKLAQQNQKQKSLFKLCIDQEVCPKCASTLHRKEKTRWFFNLEFVYTCTMSKCDFIYTR